MECNFKANVVYVVGTCFSEREKLAAPFSTSQQLVGVSINVFLGFYFSSAPGLSFQIFLLRSRGESFYSIFSCLRHLLWQAQLFPHSPQSHRQRDTAGLIGNNPSAVTTVAYRSFSRQSKRYLFAVLSPLEWTYSLSTVDGMKVLFVLRFATCTDFLS